MLCRDLLEIADSCFSDGALIESNQEAREHLEQCDPCLREVGERWSLRAVVHTAARRAPAAQISEEFIARLLDRLREVSS